MYYKFAVQAGAALGFVTVIIFSGLNRSATAFVAPPSVLCRSDHNDIKLTCGAPPSTAAEMSGAARFPRYQRHLFRKDAGGVKSCSCYSCYCRSSPSRSCFSLSTARDPLLSCSRYPRTARGSAASARRRIVRPFSSSSSMSSSESEEIANPNPLKRYDEERAGINSLLTYFSQTPFEKWNPSMLDLQLPNLLQGSLYRQTMTERLAKVASDEERERLVEVDAFLTDYLKKERRNSSRKKVSRILSAATAGGNVLDECVKDMAIKEQLDGDLDEYLGVLVQGEVDKGKKESDLYKVLKAVKDRVEAELKALTCPEIRTLAQALQVEDSDERKTFLRGAFKKLEELDNFVMFMENAMAFMGTEFRFSVRTNMPISKLDRMKSIAGEVAALRRLYLQ